MVCGFECYVVGWGQGHKHRHTLSKNRQFTQQHWGSEGLLTLKDFHELSSEGSVNLYNQSSPYSSSLRAWKYSPSPQDFNRLTNVPSSKWVEFNLPVSIFSLLLLPQPLLLRNHYFHWDYCRSRSQTNQCCWNRSDSGLRSILFSRLRKHSCYVIMCIISVNPAIRPKNPKKKQVTRLKFIKNRGTKKKIEEQKSKIYMNKFFK